MTAGYGAPREPGPALCCIGPTGLGTFVETTRIPRLDDGVVANAHGALIVCDAAIVARLCGSRTSVVLITNHLGTRPEAAQVIRQGLGQGVTICASPIPFEGVPTDLIFVDRLAGQRAYVTTPYFPDSDHVVRSLSARPLGDIHYVDVEVRTMSGRIALDAITSVDRKPKFSVWNLGAVTDLRHIVDWIADRRLPTRGVLQVSCSAGVSRRIALEAGIHRMVEASDLAVAVSRGEHGIDVVTAAGVTSIPELDPVPKAFTVGAGAALSAGIILAELDGNGAVPVGVVAAAGAAEAHDYVMGLSGREPSVHVLWRS